jgi:hypothetical protein
MNEYLPHRVGAFLSKKRNGRYYASIKFYPGYTKTKLFYTIEEGRAWIDENYDTVKSGFYDDPIEGTVALRYYDTSSYHK